MRDQIAEVAGESAMPAVPVRASARRLESGGWIVELDVGDGPRSLRGRTCVDVARAAALVIGLAVRGRSEESAGSTSQIADGEVPPWDRAESDRDAAVVVRGPEVRVARTAPRSRASWPDLAVRAAVGAATGVLPGWAAVARAGLETSGSRASVRLEAAAARGTARMSLSGGDEVAVRAQLVAAAASGCWLTRPLSWCAGVEVGQVRASAEASADQASGSGLWTAVGAGPSLVVPLTRAVALLIQAEAAVPLVFPRFSVNGERVSDPAAVSLRAGLGLHVQIP
jgi:hypothetical protein